MEVHIIKSEFKSVGYPLPFIDNVICTFKERNIDNKNKVTDDNDDEPVTPPYFFEVDKGFMLLKLQFCQFCQNSEIKNYMILQKIIFLLQSVGKQGKYKLYFV